MNKGLFIILAIDFLFRFAFQKTPTQEIKPYLLLPVKKNKLLNILLLKSATNSYNAFWLFMIVPFAFITVTKYFGITGVITYSLGFYLLMILNNYWYQMCRTLINEKTYFVIIPIVFYGLLLTLELTLGNPVSKFTMEVGELFIKGNLLSFLGVLIVAAGLGWINRTIMEKYRKHSVNNDLYSK